MNPLFESKMQYGNIDLPDAPLNEEELFHSFIDSVNNAISNKVQYDFSNPEEIEKFIDNFLEELVFCMNYDREFSIALLEIPKEFNIKRSGKDLLYTVHNSSTWHPVSQTNRKVAQKISKNHENGCACIYKYEPEGAPYPLFAVNFEFAEKKDDKLLMLYKKVAKDYIEVKEIKNLQRFLRIVIANYKFYKAGCNNET